VILSKEQSLRKCIKLWVWLTNHPIRDKEDFFEKSRSIPVLHFCYMCEYVSPSEFLNGKNCKFCLLKKCWGEKPNNIVDGYFCEYSLTSPYRAWRKAKRLYATALTSSERKTRITNARKIVAFCRKELDKIMKEKKQKKETKKPKAADKVPGVPVKKKK